MNTIPDRIEILSVSSLNAHQTLVEEMRQVSEELDIGLGWHYLLDLSWSARRLEPSRGMRVIDAGAGFGVMQWWLADQGVDLISVDCISRRNLSMRYRRRYRIQGLREEDLAPLRGSGVRGFLPPRSPLRWHLYPRKLVTSLRQRWENPQIPPGSGTVFIYNENLASMPDIPDGSVDAVVSISALEHNAPNRLRACVAELVRVLKPGGKLIATLAAAKDHDWFHGPSKGWCYTDASLRDIFGLSTDCPSNYDRYEELFEALRNSSELRENLADFYFKSGDNGMPWGIWDPKYQPVGVVKGKTT